MQCEQKHRRIMAGCSACACHASNLQCLKPPCGLVPLSIVPIGDAKVLISLNTVRSAMLSLPTILKTVHPAMLS